MKLYNYDYSDMINNHSFTYNTREKTKMTSKVYPTKLEIKVDEKTNRPYLYYEGIVQTNNGAMKVIFPKLDLVLNHASVTTISEDVKAYEMNTEFNNFSEDSILYELSPLNEDDRKDVKQYFDERFN